MGEPLNMEVKILRKALRDSLYIENTNFGSEGQVNW